jgi:Domain of unknown function (DUF5655)/Domain of unknown function (DUF4287)
MPDPQDAEAAMIRNLETNTGKSLEQWIKVAADSGLAKHGQVVSHLKSDHGLTHGYANLVAHRFFKSAATDAAPADLVAAQYAGSKAGLRSIYEALVKAIGKFGKEVEFSPKKAYVSVRRGKQFAIIQPSTATRLDVGITLKGAPPAGRLEASGSFSAMVSHRVRLAASSEVDRELLDWLRAAYDAAG